MNGRKTWNARDTFATTATLLILVGCACCGNAWALEQARTGSAGVWSTRSGAGVAGAKVWVIGGSWEEAEEVAETSADGQGAFAFPGCLGRA